jgi:hypothetical protein
MANNCLVTELKANIQGNLPKLGILTIHKTSGSRARLYGGKIANEEMVFTIIGDGHITNEAGTQDAGKTATFSVENYFEVYLSDGEYDIEITNKYAITSINCRYGSIPTLGFDINELKFNPTLSYIRLDGSNIGGYIDNIKLPSITSISTYLNPVIEGDFRSWIESTNGGMTSINLTAENTNRKISGDYLTLLGQQSNLESLDISGALFPFYGNISSLANCSLERLIVGGSYLSGSLEEFVSIASDPNGRNRPNGTLLISTYNNVTYNGEPLSNFGKSSVTVTWANGVITSVV